MCCLEGVDLRRTHLTPLAKKAFYYYYYVLLGPCQTAAAMASHFVVRYAQHHQLYTLLTSCIEDWASDWSFQAVTWYSGKNI